VYQLPRAVTLAYNLRLGHTIAHWKGIEKIDPKKPSFRPSKWPQKLKIAKNSKLPKLSKSCFEPVGKGGWPPISTWIRRSIISRKRSSIMVNKEANLNLSIHNKSRIYYSRKMLNTSSLDEVDIEGYQGRI
jgi:hypothetical protein